MVLQLELQLVSQLARSNWHEGTGTADLGFYEETLISQLQKFADLI
jgi:hypothetical protein